MARNDKVGEIETAVASAGALPLDPGKYRSELDAFDITDEQREELLMTLWSIMRSFVELGFSADLCAAVFDDITPVPGNGGMN